MSWRAAIHVAHKQGERHQDAGVPVRRQRGRSDTQGDKRVMDLQSCKVTGVMVGADAAACVEQQALYHERV